MHPKDTTRQTRRNIPESRLEALMARRGWKTSKRGWPDFLCFDQWGNIRMVVEVKPRLANGSLYPLRPEQYLVMKWLQRQGVKCYVSDGEKLIPFNPATMDPVDRWH